MHFFFSFFPRNVDHIQILQPPPPPNYRSVKLHKSAFVAVSGWAVCYTMESILHEHKSSASLCVRLTCYRNNQHQQQQPILKRYKVEQQRKCTMAGNKDAFVCELLVIRTRFFVSLRPQDNGQPQNTIQRIGFECSEFPLSGRDHLVIHSAVIVVYKVGRSHSRGGRTISWKLSREGSELHRFIYFSCQTQHYLWSLDNKTTNTTSYIFHTLSTSLSNRPVNQKKNNCHNGSLTYPDEGERVQIFRLRVAHGVVSVLRSFRRSVEYEVCCSVVAVNPIKVCCRWQDHLTCKSPFSLDALLLLLLQIELTLFALHIALQLKIYSTTGWWITLCSLHNYLIQIFNTDWSEINK